MQVELDCFDQQQEQNKHRGHLEEAREAAYESGGTQSRDTHGAATSQLLPSLSLILSTSCLNPARIARLPVGGRKVRQTNLDLKVQLVK